MSRREPARPASRFAGRVVVVTGAAAGLGAAVVDRVLAEGGQVAGLDVDGRAPVRACGYRISRATCRTGPLSRTPWLLSTSGSVGSTAW